MQLNNTLSPQSTGMTLQIEALRAKYIGRLCQAMHPADIVLSPKDCFWVKIATKLSEDVKIDIHTDSDLYKFKSRGSQNIWWMSGYRPLDIAENELVLVVDIIRDVSNQKPKWSAVILFKENTYIIAMESLFFGETNLWPQIGKSCKKAI